MSYNFYELVIQVRCEKFVFPREKEKKKKSFSTEEDSKEFIDVRRASETASKSAARRVMFALGRYEMYYLFSLFFPSSRVKSQRVLDIHFL